MLRTLFTQTERFLIRNQQVFTLRSKNTGHESTSDSGFDEKKLVRGPYYEQLLTGALCARDRDGISELLAARSRTVETECERVGTIAS